jgi:hypothetical protein
MAGELQALVENFRYKQPSHNRASSHASDSDRSEPEAA